MTLLTAPKLKVGLFAIMVLVGTAYMALKVGDNPSLMSGGHEHYFMLPDAGGLVKGSQVKVSGIPVGIIRDIKLVGAEAKIVLLINEDLSVTTSSAARIKSQGILGDKYVDIYPGSPTDAPLVEGQEIVKVIDQGSLDKVVSDIGQVSESIKLVAKNLAEAVSDDGTNKHVLGRILLNVETLTRDLAEVTSENKHEVAEIIDNLNSVTKTLDEVINEKGPDGSKSKLKISMERLDNSLKNIEEITEKINKGEGTLGKLVSDEATAEKVENAIDGINELLGGANSIETRLDFQAQYLGNIGGAKTLVGVELVPGIDRAYYLGIVDDPSGLVETTDIAITSPSGVTDTSEKKTYHNKLKFNIWFAKSFYNLTVRAGLFESSGGVGFDYHIIPNKLKFSTEFLEFSNLNMRAYFQYNLWKGVSVTAGAQDIFNNGKKYSGYLGAGILLTNDDLKMLLTSLPTP